MKLKFLVPIFLSIIIGTIFGKIIFNGYKSEIENVFNETTTVYFFQQGVYSSLETMKEHTKNLNNYIYKKDDKYYRVFIAITSNEELIEKIKEVYMNKGNDIYIKTYSISNSTFLETLKQYDKLLELTNNSSDIEVIQKQILSKYEELILSAQ